MCVFCPFYKYKTRRADGGPTQLLGGRQHQRRRTAAGAQRIGWGRRGSGGVAFFDTQFLEQKRGPPTRGGAGGRAGGTGRTGAQSKARNPAPSLKERTGRGDPYRYRGRGRQAREQPPTPPHDAGRRRSAASRTTSTSEPTTCLVVLSRGHTEVSLFSTCAPASRRRSKKAGLKPPKVSNSAGTTRMPLSSGILYSPATGAT